MIVLEAQNYFKSMRLSSDPARVFMLFCHPWSNPTFDAVRRFFCIWASGTERGRANQGCCCKLTCRVSRWWMQRSDAHCAARRRQRSDADSGAGRGINALWCSKWGKQWDVFPVWRFCCSHFYINGTAWRKIRADVLEVWMPSTTRMLVLSSPRILPLVSWSFFSYFLPYHCARCFHTL